MRKRMLACVCLCAPLVAQEPPKTWWASVAASAAANSADAWTSIGKYELNPLFRGKDGMFDPAKAAGFKGGMLGLSAVSQYYILKKHPRMARVFEIANFGQAAVYGAVAIHNSRVPNYHPAGRR